MNCKPNQLALITRNTSDDPCLEPYLGMPVRTRFTEATEIGPVWLCSGFPAPCKKCGGTRFCFLDADLTPFKDDTDVHDDFNDILAEIGLHAEGLRFSSRATENAR